MNRRSKELYRFLKFSVVGAFGAVVDFGTFNLLHARAGFPDVPASVVSFVAAIISNFLWNRYWTYPDSRTKSVRHQAGQFAVVSLAGLAIRTPAFALLLGPCTSLAESILAASPAVAAATTADTVGANLALATAVIIVLFWNFFVNRYWTYADVDAPTSSPDRPRIGTPPV